MAGQTGSAAAACAPLSCGLHGGPLGVNALAYVGGPLGAEAIYDLFFRTANRVLKEVAAKYLSGKVGVTAVLHTWGQTLEHHIHLHCMVSGGALVEREDGYTWRNSAPGFLFPVNTLS